jgi:hypothetical protein
MVTAAVSYLWRPSARERSRTNVVDEDNRSRPQGRVVVLVEEDQCCTYNASEGLHTVYRRHPGSVPTEQRKKVDLAGNPAARRCPEQEVFLQHADTAPNMGAKPGGREEEEGMNEPRPPGGYIVGREGVGGRP